MSPEDARPSLSERVQARSSFCERIARLLDMIDCRKANAGEQRDAIFHLRYRAYMRGGKAALNSSKSTSDPYDDVHNVHLFGLYINDELASSIRIHLVTRESPSSPSLELFPEVLRTELDASKVIIEMTYFVTNEKLSRLHPELPHATLRLGWLAAGYFGADHFLAAVDVQHQEFLRRTFHHRAICGPRQDPRLAKAVTLMTSHYASVAAEVHRRYPFFRSSFFERRMLFEHLGF
jgi:N-acyl-L-homoserine lactone synthetase